MELTSLAIDRLRQLIKVAIGSSLQPRSVLGGQPIKMLMTLVKCLNKELLGQALEISLVRLQRGAKRMVSGQIGHACSASIHLLLQERALSEFKGSKNVETLVLECPSGV